MTPNYYRILDEQPPLVEVKFAPGLYVRQMWLKKAGTLVPQHSHATGHLSMVAMGSVRVWKESDLLGDFHWPCGLMIEGGAKHTFLSLTDNCVVYCVHAVDENGEPKIVAEHQLAGGA